MLYRLVYLSRSLNQVADGSYAAEIADWVAVTRRNNAACGVTGVLMLSGQRFVHVLEGRREAVDGIFAWVGRDPRHGAVTVLCREPVTQRAFGSDVMTVIGGTRRLQDLLDGCVGGGHGREPDPERVASLLEELAAGARQAAAQVSQSAASEPLAAPRAGLDPALLRAELARVAPLSVTVPSADPASVGSAGPLADLAATALDAFFATALLSADGRVLSANASYLKLFGLSPDTIGADNGPVPASTMEPSTFERGWATLGGGESWVVEHSFRRLDEGLVFVESRFLPSHDETGRLRSVLHLASDVTERRRRATEQDEQIKAIAKAQAVITFDMNGIVLSANAIYLDAMGYTLDEVEGRHHRMFVEPAYSHGADYASFWRDLARGRHQAGQYRRFGKGGREVWLQAIYNPVLDTDGTPVRVVKHATVVTEEKLRQAEHQGQIAAIHKAQCVVSFDLDGTILDANENFLKLLNYRLSEVRGRHHRMLVDPATANETVYTTFWADLAAGRHQTGEYRRVGKGGREVWLQATYHPILDMAGRPFRIVKYATDVTAEKLRHADAQGQIAAMRKSQGVVELAMDGTILDVNDVMRAMLGFEGDKLPGQHHRILVEPGYAESSDYEDFWRTLRSGAFLSGMYKRIGKNGREIWIQASYNPIFDLGGRPVKVVKFATDVTSNIALAEAYEDAKRQAQHDFATALPNRYRLTSFMQTALAPSGARLAVLYLDLDRFKPINDTFGHAVGDRVLGEVADRLRRMLRNDQLAARIGGDEFVIAAPDLTGDEIEALCQRLIDGLSAPIESEGNKLLVRASIGVATSPSDATTPDELLRCADVALYRSKQKGGGLFSFFAADMNDRLDAYRKGVDDLRLALLRNEFFLEYQPRFDHRGKVVRSVEALLRWAHPERGRISPGDFIPLAERSGLIIPLGEWVLLTACQTAAAWPGVGVSVNVSPLQFRTDLVGVVRSALEVSGLDPNRLELEITEGVLLEDADRAHRALKDLKAIGLRLAMDDFGTGYSSLSSLRSFPFDVIKIDRQFVADIHKQDGREVVQAILRLGKALGLSVTAEGVETEEQLAILAANECNEVQGFLMGRPMHPQAITDLLRRVEG